MTMYLAEYMRDRGERFMPMHEQLGRGNDVFHVVRGGVCLLVVVLGVVLAYKLISKYIDAKHQVQDPLELAKVRFAKGEISKTELADIKKELKS